VIFLLCTDPEREDTAIIHSADVVARSILFISVWERSMDYHFITGLPFRGVDLEKQLLLPTG